MQGLGMVGGPAVSAHLQQPWRRTQRAGRRLLRRGDIPSSGPVSPAAARPNYRRAAPLGFGMGIGIGGQVRNKGGVRGGEGGRGFTKHGSAHNHWRRPILAWIDFW